ELLRSKYARFAMVAAVNSKRTQKRAGGPSVGVGSVFGEVNHALNAICMERYRSGHFLVLRLGQRLGECCRRSSAIAFAGVKVADWSGCTSTRISAMSGRSHHFRGP